MIASEISRTVFALPEEERLELARQLVESVGSGDGDESALTEGIRRIEDVVSGRVEGLTEAEFRAALE